MARKTMEQMLEQRTKLEARIRSAQARQAASNRQRDTRRKILAGSYMLNIAGNDWLKVGRELAASGLLDVRDRELFGLPPIE